MTRAVLALGSNLGDRYARLRDAVRALDDVLLVVSGVYENPPWGDPAQPDYLNAVALVADPDATAVDWLARCRALEQAAGRVRDADRPYGPRSLDVDVVAVWAADGAPVHSDDPELVLPHPRAHLRAFVLRPWIDITPYGQLPGHGWLTDLLGREPVASDLRDLRPRPDLPLESAQ
ncbi:MULTISPECIES: 2-amino-4-hydroxy-6-hydroxymethyldihydropteridine diphosphokinase [unclassified Solwaraspora]|uniref:2-amino-4-hydroxy-6- hydroxymethyldihydropteridine diphosphokinase n=1 Tax=unclassified Solwaraspora TaxID=2627926 RepID=UPI00259B310E|nr:2-amino-4-hydroxy-6-hydroxymethyldihydropteridine diphosphokinase [Solwaraspora sp. WMMA2056]WJK41193.1 2-amino-4-hydroxy-6-hydroxymethyldihydropteridine diphosphokinase [Solwaraspora sp. WMMA2056]